MLRYLGAISARYAHTPQMTPTRPHRPVFILRQGDQNLQKSVEDQSTAIHELKDVVLAMQQAQVRVSGLDRM